MACADRRDLCYLFYYTGRQTLGFAVAGIQHDYGLSKYEIGWISATMLWCYAGGQFINGNLGDKLGGKTMMIAGAVLSVAANWLFSFGHTFLFFLLAWGLNGYFQSMGFAPGSRLLSNWWDHKHRGFVYGGLPWASRIFFGASLCFPSRHFGNDAARLGLDFPSRTAFHAPRRTGVVAIRF